MRVELALILGIVVFCCWCAYIVAQMSASVAPNAASAANPVDQQQHQNRPLQGGPQHNTWASVVGEPPPHLLQAQATQASGDHVLSSSSSGGGGNNNNNDPRPFFAPAAEPHEDRQPLRSLVYRANNSLLAGHHQGDHFAPNHNYNARHQFARLQEASAPPVALAPANHQFTSGQFARQQQQTPFRPTLNYDSSAALWPAAYNALQVPIAGQGDVSVEPADEQQVNDDEDDQRQPQADQERDQQATGTDQEEPDDEQAPQTELEETSRRRSFDENEYDSSERDRHGNVIKSRRRHLLNGKPLGDGTAAPAGSERAPTSLTNDSDEFERLVDEIDSERAANKNAETGDESNTGDAEEGEPADSPAAATTPATSDELAGDASARPPGSVVVAERRRDAFRRAQPNNTRIGLSPGANRGSTRPRAAGEARKHVDTASKSGKPNDLHEHSMHETLSAQQWDDDSSLARAPGSGAQSGDDDDEQEAEEESRRLEEMSNDLLFNNVDQPDEPRRPGPGTRPARRRRRSTDNAAARTTSESSSNQIYSNQPNVSHVVRYDDENEEQARRQIGEPGGDSQTVRLSNTSAIDQRNDNGGNIFIKTHSRPALGAQRPADAITGQEDISVEVLADPPAPRPPSLLSFYPAGYVGASTGQSLTNLSLAHQQQQQPSVFANYGPNYQLQTIGASVPTQPVVSAPAPYQHQAMSQVHQMGASFPQIESPFASGSAKKVTKKKKKKTKKKLSKGVNSKYKAAKAYEAKLKSKQKKGKMYKKKKKSHKNLKAGKKNFAGSIQGKKASSGSGHKGADKGANFFKNKGYKKRGFKKVYHKLETGDHKTYFDEFRDKDHNKKWKKFDDKHKYSKKKKWSGNDTRHVHHHKSDEAKGKASKDGQWKEKASSKHMKKSQKLKKSKKAEHSEGFERKKKKKKKVEKDD